MSQTVVGVILAAGQGTRMKASRVKVLHELAGRPMIDYVLEAVKGAGTQRALVVVGYQGEQVAEHITGRAETIYQAEQLGTGHAVLQTRDRLAGQRQDVLVVAGDVPLITPNILTALSKHHQKSGAAATLLSARVQEPAGYGRIVRDAAGQFERIVEQADIDAAAGSGETACLGSINEVNTSICIIENEVVFDYLSRLETDNAQGEYYLVDVFALMRDDGLDVQVYRTHDVQAVMGVNDQASLARAGAVMRERINQRLMLSGVTIVDPAATYIDAGVRVAADTVIYPGTMLRGSTEIGSGCELGPGTDIVDSEVGCETIVVRSTVENSRVGRQVKLGPYAHVRPNSELADGVKVGNYAEVKNSRIGRGSKISHHSYIGDTEMGEEVNIGAGVVTVNYDGYKKHRTIIEARAFIGCNVNLVAPVRVGAGAYVAAGSTITKDVPSQALGVGRSRQRNIGDWCKRWHGRHQSRDQ